MNPTLEAGWKVPPGRENEQGKHGVPGNEHPRRRAVIEQLLKPVLDEAAAVRCRAGARTKPHFENGERTNEVEPRLRDDDTDGCSMSDSKPGVVHPLPVFEIANDDEQQPCNDKRRNADVNDQHGVGEQQTERGIEQHRLEGLGRYGCGRGGLVGGRRTLAGEPDGSHAPKAASAFSSLSALASCRTAGGTHSGNGTARLT